MNKVALVNKELHTRLFQTTDEEGNLQTQPKVKKQTITGPLLLRSMIKKGLTATTNSIIGRPKTAQSSFKPSRNTNHTLDRTKSIEHHELERRNWRKRYQIPAESPIDFQSSKTPKEFQQFQSILVKAVRDLKREGERKKVKLEKYSQKKFSYVWKRFNIPK